MVENEHWVAENAFTQVYFPIEILLKIIEPIYLGMRTYFKYKKEQRIKAAYQALVEFDRENGIESEAQSKVTSLLADGYFQQAIDEARRDTGMGGKDVSKAVRVLYTKSEEVAQFETEISDKTTMTFKHEFVTMTCLCYLNVNVEKFKLLCAKRS